MRSGTMAAVVGKLLRNDFIRLQNSYRSRKVIFQLLFCIKMSIRLLPLLSQIHQQSLTLRARISKLSDKLLKSEYFEACLPIIQCNIFY